MWEQFDSFSFIGYEVSQNHRTFVLYMLYKWIECHDYIVLIKLIEVAKYLLQF